MTDRYIPQITPPVINLNGTSKQELLGQTIAIIEALRATQRLQLAACPHGRDFQTLSPLTGERLQEKQARDQHRARVLTTERLLMDYEALALAISNQGK